MNLKEQKLALENSVKEALAQALNEHINITSTYNTDKGAMNVTITEHNDAAEGKNANTLYYGITYTEEDTNIAIIAFNRIFIADELSIIDVIVEPVAIDEKFIGSVKNIIAFGMDKIYHPERYQAPAAEQPSKPVNVDLE